MVHLGPVYRSPLIAERSKSLMKGEISDSVAPFISCRGAKPQLRRKHDQPNRGEIVHLESAPSLSSTKVGRYFFSGWATLLLHSSPLHLQSTSVRVIYGVSHLLLAVCVLSRTPRLLGSGCYRGVTRAWLVGISWSCFFFVGQRSKISAN